MKRAVLCVRNPQNYIDTINDHSIMIINPDSTDSRLKYLLDNSDYSLLITDSGSTVRNGKDYPNEKLFWYTSGTTGDSKFCSFSQDQLNQMALTICNSYNISDNDRYVSIMPLWHAHGQGLYWAAKRAGCEIHYTTVKNIKSLEKHSPTFISAIPEILNVVKQLDLKDLRFIRSASSALPNNVYLSLKEKFNVPVIEAFGMTESLSHCFTNPLIGKQKIGTVGMPSGIEADIIDEQLHIKGPCLFKPGWYNTGDLASKDQDGYYTILGRYKDQINVRGIKLNPLSLENQLLSNVPGVSSCVIFGKNQVKCLFVGNVNKDDISAYLTSLGQYCKPVLVKCVDSIPISPMGKISRTWLDLQY